MGGDGSGGGCQLTMRRVVSQGNLSSLRFAEARAGCGVQGHAMRAYMN